MATRSVAGTANREGIAGRLGARRKQRRKRGGYSSDAAPIIEARRQAEQNAPTPCYEWRWGEMKSPNGRTQYRPNWRFDPARPSWRKLRRVNRAFPLGQLGVGTRKRRRALGWARDAFDDNGRNPALGKTAARSCARAIEPDLSFWLTTNVQLGRCSILLLDRFPHLLGGAT